MIIIINDTKIVAFFRIPSALFGAALSINTPKSSKVFMNLIIPSISSFKLIKINSFHVLTALFPIILLSNLYTAFEGKLFTSPGKLYLAKGIVTSIITNLPKLHNQEPKDLSNFKVYIC